MPPGKFLLKVPPVSDLAPPVVVKAPAWMQAALYAATVLASVFGALYHATPVAPTVPVIVQPVPPTPAPAPLPLPQPVPPTPAPAPLPLPQPTPTPAPAILSIVDSKDQPVTNNVDAGRILNVSCPEGFRIFGLIQPMPSSGDISHISPTRLQVALVPGGLVQIFMYNMADTPVVTIVRCNQAPQPPPSPVVVPPPSPQPTPTPLPSPQPGGKVIISIIEDAPNRPPAVVKVLNDFAYWESLRRAGHTVRVWNGAQPTPSPEADAQADIGIVNGVLPSIVIRKQADRSLLYSGKLPPTADETKSLVSRYIP